MDNVAKSACIIPLDALIGEAIGLPFPEAASDLKMLVVTNKSRTHGASAILSAEVQEEVLRLAGTNCYILPSSIHEVIAFPVMKGNEEEADYLLQMVKEINQEVVEPKEKLTDALYLLTEEKGLELYRG